MTEPLTPEALAQALDDQPAFRTYARLTRRVNAQNGWRPDHTPEQAFKEVPELVALIHSEITEAFREAEPAARNRELGDVIIRCLDMGVLLQPLWVPLEPLDNLLRWPLPTMLMVLHAHATDALEAYRKSPPETVVTDIHAHLEHLIDGAHSLIHEYGGETKVILADILQANLQRGYRHGGRRA